MSCLSLHLLWNMVMQIVMHSVCTSGEGRASQSYVTSKALRRNSTPIEAGAAIKTSPCLTLSSPGRVKLKRGGLERFWKYPNLFRRQSPTSQEMWIHSLCFIISSVRSSNSHPDLLLIHHPPHPLFQITPILKTGLSLSEPLQLYKGYNAI